MTTFYLDFEGGNDAADGTSFANRWKTINSGATYARIAPGDTIRVMASPTPTSLGSCTWTDGSGTVTLGSAATQTIWNGDEAWTGVSANISQANNTTRIKIGSTCPVISPASGFTTGVVCYKTLASTLDLSAYQKVSCWALIGGTTSAFQLRLCTDASGATAAHTFTFSGQVSNNWVLFEFDNGSALNSGINSVGLYAASDPGTVQIRIQNIIASKAGTASGALSHTSVLYIDDGDGEAYWPIDTIDGTSVVLGGYYGRTGLGSSDGARTPYRGTGGSLTTYALTTIQHLSQQDVQDSGTDGAPITFDCGWNRTDMSAKADWSASGITERTFLSGQYRLLVFTSLGTRSDIVMNGLGLCHGYDDGIYCGNNPGFELNDFVASGVRYPVEAGESTVAGGKLVLNNTVATMCAYGFYEVHGLAYRVEFNSITARCMYDGGLYMNVAMGGVYIFDGFLESGTSNAALYISGGSAGDVVAYDTSFVTQGSNDIALAGTQNVRGNFVKCSFSQSSWIDTSGASRYSLATSHAHGGTVDDHRLQSRGWNGGSESSVRHTASGIAWRVSPTDSTYCDSQSPALIPLARVAIASGTAATIKCYVRRTNTGLACGILLNRSAYSASDSAAMTAAADTWEELTITTDTVAQNDVVEVFGYAYGGTTYSAYFDDMTITQA